MTNADWWARVVQARTERDDLRPQRVWALRKDGHEAAIDLKAAAVYAAGHVFYSRGAGMFIGIISLREGLDWTTPSGRLQAQLRCPPLGGPPGEADILWAK